MSEREGGGQQRANRDKQTVDETVDKMAAQDASVAEVQERKEALDADVDSLLDEIDEVLEENAEEFVKGYVQKGGQ